jgi:hypothetical protein
VDFAHSHRLFLAASLNHPLVFSASVSFEADFFKEMQMIISKKYALKLVAKGSAELLGIVEHDGVRYMSLNRFDKNRTDHYKVS